MDGDATGKKAFGDVITRIKKVHGLLDSVGMNITNIRSRARNQNRSGSCTTPEKSRCEPNKEIGKNGTVVSRQNRASRIPVPKNGLRHRERSHFKSGCRNEPDESASGEGNVSVERHLNSARERLGRATSRSAPNDSGVCSEPERLLRQIRTRYRRGSAPGPTPHTCGTYIRRQDPSSLRPSSIPRPLTGLRSLSRNLSRCSSEHKIGELAERRKTSPRKPADESSKIGNWKSKATNPSKKDSSTPIKTTVDDAARNRNSKPKATDSSEEDSDTPTNSPRIPPLEVVGRDKSAETRLELQLTKKFHEKMKSQEPSAPQRGRKILIARKNRTRTQPTKNLASQNNATSMIKTHVVLNTNEKRVTKRSETASSHVKGTESVVMATGHPSINHKADLDIMVKPSHVSTSVGNSRPKSNIFDLKSNSNITVAENPTGVLSVNQKADDLGIVVKPSPVSTSVGNSSPNSNIFDSEFNSNIAVDENPAGIPSINQKTDPGIMVKPSHVSTSGGNITSNSNVFDLGFNSNITVDKIPAGIPSTNQKAGLGIMVKSMHVTTSRGNITPYSKIFDLGFNSNITVDEHPPGIPNINQKADLGIMVTPSPVFTSEGNSIPNSNTVDFESNSSITVDEKDIASDLKSSLVDSDASIIQYHFSSSVKRGTSETVTLPRNNESNGRDVHSAWAWMNKDLGYAVYESDNESRTLSSNTSKLSPTKQDSASTSGYDTDGFFGMTTDDEGHSSETRSESQALHFDHDTSSELSLCGIDDTGKESDSDDGPYSPFASDGDTERSVVKERLRLYKQDIEASCTNNSSPEKTILSSMSQEKIRKKVDQYEQRILDDSKPLYPPVPSLHSDIERLLHGFMMDACKSLEKEEDTRDSYSLASEDLPPVPPLDLDFLRTDREMSQEFELDVYEDCKTLKSTSDSDRTHLCLRAVQRSFLLPIEQAGNSKIIEEKMTKATTYCLTKLRSMWKTSTFSRSMISRMAKSVLWKIFHAITTLCFLVLILAFGISTPDKGDLIRSSEVYLNDIIKFERVGPPNCVV